MLNVLSKADTPLKIENYTLLEKPPTNTLFYGIILRSELDSDKVTINKKYSPQKFYTVARYDDGYGVLYFYGSFITPQKKYNKLFSSIDSFNNIDNHTLNNYEKILSLYNLHCKDTYRFFSPGIYPIDCEYREQLFTSKNNFHDFFKAKKDLPFFITIVSPVILYFSNIEKNIFEFQKFLTTSTKF